MELRHWYVLGLTAFAGLCAGTTWAGGWVHDRHDQNGTSRSDGTGAIDGSDAQRPSIIVTKNVRNRPLDNPLLFDTNGDLVGELLVALGSRAAAIDAETGETVWASPSRDISRLIALNDLDGNGSMELIATAGGTSGGIYVLDPETGAILYSVNGLPERSGVDFSEVALGDANGDGIDDLVFPAAVSGVDGVWFVSFADGFDNAVAIGQTFPGYNNLTPAVAGGFLDGRDTYVVDQGRAVSLFGDCSPDDENASCDENELQCWCLAGAFEDVHTNNAFGPALPVDLDGDGVQELYSVKSHPSHLDVVAVLSFEKGLSGGQANSDDLVQWYRSYVPADGPFTRVSTPPQTPVDLDGNEGPELLVSFFNNRDGDRDRAGGAFEDGIDAPDTTSFGVFSPIDGTLLFHAEDEYAYGWVDLDKDGIWEIVTTPTTGWSWQDGIRGIELDCDNGCTAQTAWESPNYTLIADPSVLDGVGVPQGAYWLRFGAPGEETRLNLLDVDNDGDEELLAYGDGELVALSAENGLEEVASLALGPDETLRAIDTISKTAVIADGADFRVVASGLEAVRGPTAIPSQGAQPWFALPLDESPFAAFDGEIYSDGLNADAGSQLLPEIILAHDLDGDGAMEVVSRRTAEDGGAGFTVRVDTWDAESSSFDTLWTRNSVGDPLLEEHFSFAPMMWAVGDFDGAGALDIAFVASRSGEFRVFILDGDTGGVNEAFLIERPASRAPLLVADVVDAGGSFGGDGIDDIVVSGTGRTQILTPGTTAPVQKVDNTTPHFLGVNADIDDDGVEEVIGTLSATTENSAEAIDPASGLNLSWGPIVLGRPSGSVRIIAAAAIDGTAGDDVLYATGDGAIEVYGGTTGSMMTGFPVYLADGQLLAAEPELPDVPRSMAVYDVDGDNHLEALVGATNGWLYALNVEDAEGAPSLLWSVEVGASVEIIAIGDVDGDESDEILLSLLDGRGVVLDGDEVLLTIETPEEDQCIEKTTIEVDGKAIGVETVDVSLNGELLDPGLPVIAQGWDGAVKADGAGEYEITAEGRNGNGEVIAIATRQISVGADEDGDGYTVCGGDCDDANPMRNPGESEVCGDGVDQDCDGEDDPCPNDDGGDPTESGGDDGNDTMDEAGAGEDDGGDGCSCSTTRRSKPLLLLIPIILGLSRWRRKAA